MDSDVDATVHVILGKFEKPNKRYKEKIIKEIIAAISVLC
jgi:hypothetical protein